MAQIWALESCRAEGHRSLLRNPPPDSLISVKPLGFMFDRRNDRGQDVVDLAFPNNYRTPAASRPEARSRDRRASRLR